MHSRDPQERPPTRRETLVPAAAVAAVAIVAVTAAVMVKRAETPAPEQQLANREPAGPIASVDVVKAPPLKAPDTARMGGAPACRDCGVVQMVVAVNEPGSSQPRAYQMHIRMDNGSVRTIEQRGALPAGSRVTVEGDTVKPVS